jgi:hypothetical protein
VNDPVSTCPVCSEPARLHCAGCDRVFCTDHLQRRFAMGYFYLCAECIAKQGTGAIGAKRGRQTRDHKP